METTRRGLISMAAGAVVAGAAVTETAQAAGAPGLAEHPMIARVWHGRPPAAKAEDYRKYLFEAGVQAIAKLPGNRGVKMLAGIAGETGDFTVISFWDSIDAIKGYAGEDYTKVHDLPRDSEFLIDHEKLVRHYHLDVDFRQG